MPYLSDDHDSRRRDPRGLLLLAILLLVSASVVILAAKWNDIIPGRRAPSPSPALNITTTTEAEASYSQTSASGTEATEPTGTTPATLPTDENSRRELLGDFYVPLPEVIENRRSYDTPVRGIYVGVAQIFNPDQASAYASYVSSLLRGETAVPASANKTERAVGLALATDINALVFDVKDDGGNLTWASDVAAIHEIGADRDNWQDYAVLLDYLRAHDIRSIARIVSFKDPFLASALPEHAIQLKAGGVYVDNGGDSWVNPYDKYVQDYAIAAAMEAALRGFDEIQFDYVRFPDNASVYNETGYFPYQEGRDKSLAVEEYLLRARTALEAYQVAIGADVFGITTHTWNSQPEDIGQTWRLVTNQVDSISPMLYPSHYSQGWYGQEFPDAAPGPVIQAALREAIERNAAQPGAGIIRPYYQAFTAPWVAGSIPYGPAEIQAQIIAGFDLGVDEYLLWNANGSYDPLIFTYDPTIGRLTQDPVVDALGRTPEQTLALYLEGLSKPYYPTLYLLEHTADRQARYEDFREFWLESDLYLSAWGSAPGTMNPDGSWTGRVDCTFVQGDTILEALSLEFSLEQEKGVWHVAWPQQQHYTDLFETTP